MTNLLTLLAALLGVAVVVLAVRAVLYRRERDRRHAAARARRAEQDRIWHDRMRERAGAAQD